jgi:FAD:protein FMN transferase
MSKLLTLCILIAISLFFDCKNTKEKCIKLEGNAQGSTYHISYYTKDSLNYKPQIDSLFSIVDSSVSMYKANSIISAINNNDSSVRVNEHFTAIFNKAMEVSHESDGAFDITVGPLVNAYGFGATKKKHIDKVYIDSLLQFVGYKKVKIVNGKLIKSAPGVKIDMNAIAQGYTVDLISNFFESKGISKYLVEVGGEVRAKGKKPDENYWKIGVDKPIDNNNVPGENLQVILMLKDRSIATSGNYRKFYEENGVKYSHHIDPKTGRTQHNNLLSVSISAKDCTTSDAYATACLVLGFEKSQELLKKHPELEAYMVYSDKTGKLQVFCSEGLQKMIVENGSH